jgi:hypothetical protein
VREKNHTMLKFYLITFAILLAINLNNCQNSGSITVRNRGAFMARYWITFILNREEFTNSTEWFSAGQSRHLEFPFRSTNGHLIVQNLVFIGTWRNVFSLDIILPTGNRCFSVWGTTLIPHWTSENC